MLRLANWMAYENFVPEPADVTRIQRYLCGLTWSENGIEEIKKVAHLKALCMFDFL